MNNHIQVKAQLKRSGFFLDVDLNISQRVTALFGPSGSGKSTLLNIIAGITNPDSGRIIIHEQCLFDDKQNISLAIHQRRIGVVFQDSRLFPHMSVEQNLRYALKAATHENHAFGFTQMTELFEIQPLLKQHPHQLSGGEKQRIALGRALLSSPQLLILDEPLASLDERLKNQILPFLKRMIDEIEIPMIYISHAKQEIAHLTEHVILIENGKSHT